MPFELKSISTMVWLLDNASALLDKGNCVLCFWPHSGGDHVDGNT